MKARIDAKVIEHSLFRGKELITIETYAPKFLDAEIEKHRMISSNSTSDRAIPIKRMKEMDFFLPDDVRLNQSGMQGSEKLEGLDKTLFISSISILREEICELLTDFDYIHKQHLNRYLLPFSMQKKIMTANKEQWEYFLSLRLHSSADPAIYKLAKCIKKAINHSKPKHLLFHEWHLPYILQEERYESFINIELAKMSSARCARISYNNHDGSKPDVKKDFKLFNDLVISDPHHATPSEHQAIPLLSNDDFNTNGISHIIMNEDDEKEYCSGNFRGFIQFRKMLEDSKWKI